jgi:hypothetical protein
MVRLFLLFLLVMIFRLLTISRYLPIAPSIIYPDDTDTWEGWVINYNRVRMIAASILFHHGADGSFPQLARENVRHDMHLVLSYTPEMILFVAAPNEFFHGTMN